MSNNVKQQKKIGPIALAVIKLCTSAKQSVENSAE